MADETQNAPVASAETATQENEKKLYVYYFSDPDAKDPLLMKNARKSPYFNAGMDRAKLT